MAIYKLISNFPYTYNRTISWSHIIVIISTRSKRERHSHCYDNQQ